MRNQEIEKRIKLKDRIKRKYKLEVLEKRIFEFDSDKEFIDKISRWYGLDYK